MRTQSNMRCFYKPNHHAFDCSYAVNLYTGCPHRCEYCFGAKQMHRSEQAFSDLVVPRAAILDKVRADAKALRDNDEIASVLLCHACDPYLTGLRTKTTRFAILDIHQHRHGIAVLTKNPYSAQADFDVMKSCDVRFGVSLSTINDASARRYEQRAPSATDRIFGIERAKNDWRLRTFVVADPIWDVSGLCNLIVRVARSADIWYIGDTHLPVGTVLDMAPVIDILRHVRANYVLMNNEHQSPLENRGVAAKEKNDESESDVPDRARVRHGRMPAATSE